MLKMFINDATGLIIGVGLLLALAWVPAEIARNRGYIFWKWYAYGLFLFPLALVQSVSLHNRYRKIIPLKSKKSIDFKRSVLGKNISYGKSKI